MATSGSASKTVTSWDTLKFSWSRTSYSVPNNTSTISWKLELISTTYGAIYSAPSKTWTVTVNGTKHTGTASASIGNNATKTLASGTDTITHNNDGTKTFAFSFSHNFSITFSNKWIGEVSGSGTGTLDTIPRYASITEAPDFNDEATNLTIRFNNPGNFDLKLKIEAGGDTALIVRDKVTKTSPYTFVLTEAEKKKLRQKCTKNELTVRFTVATYLNGVESKWSYIDKTMTLINGTPTLNPTVADVGSVSTTLTGDPNKLIMHYNVARVTFNAAGAKEATISSMKVTCGNASRTSDGDMSYIESGTFVFTVTDSRGNSASKTITKDVIDYIPLTCNLSTNSDLVDGSSANVNLSITGRYFAGSFGAITNSLTVEYRYKVNDGDYPTDSEGNEIWTPLTGAPSNGEYTAQGVVTGLDYTDSFTFQARAKDAVYSSGITTVEQVVRIQPVFDWGENDFNFNVPVHGAGGFTYDIPVGSYDLNEVITSGKYYAGNDSTNRPINKNGWLEVQTYGDGNYCYQKYIVYSGEKYERWKNDGTWGDWNEINKSQHTLWTGASHMTASQTAYLSESVSSQKTGIQLIFSSYENSTGTVKDYNFRPYTFLKSFIPSSGTRTCSFTLHSPTYAYMGSKELYVGNTRIIGSQWNTVAGTASGITYDNKNWVLRYVIGF